MTTKKQKLKCKRCAQLDWRPGMDSDGLCLKCARASVGVRNGSKTKTKTKLSNSGEKLTVRVLDLVGKRAPETTPEFTIDPRYKSGGDFYVATPDHNGIERFARGFLFIEPETKEPCVAQTYFVFTGELKEYDRLPRLTLRPGDDISVDGIFYTIGPANSDQRTIRLIRRHDAH